MLKVRLIPVLLLRRGRMVKGKRFADFRDTGDPISAARIYNAQNADELAFVDTEASREGRGALLQIVERVAEECFMPFTVGGGIRTIEDIRNLLNAGADKVLITTAAVENPRLIAEGSEIFGRQCLVVGIDALRHSDGYQLYTHGGRTPANVEMEAHFHRMQEMGAGEFLVNSIDNDGMMQGYDSRLLKLASEYTDRPVIALGGAGNFQHLADVLRNQLAHAVACASLFHFGDNNPIRARAFLKNEGFPVKNV